MRLEDSRIEGISPVDRPDVAAAGEVVEVKAGVGQGPNSSDLGPDAAYGVDFIEVSADGAGVSEG